MRQITEQIKTVFFCFSSNLRAPSLLLKRTQTCTRPGWVSKSKIYSRGTLIASSAAFFHHVLYYDQLMYSVDSLYCIDLRKLVDASRVHTRANWLFLMTSCAFVRVGSVMQYLLWLKWKKPAMSGKRRLQFVTRWFYDFTLISIFYLGYIRSRASLSVFIMGGFSCHQEGLDLTRHCCCCSSVTKQEQVFPRLQLWNQKSGWFLSASLTVAVSAGDIKQTSFCVYVITL